MKNILITVGTFNYGGTQQLLLHWAKYINPENYSIFIMGHDENIDMLPEWEKEFKNVFVIPTTKERFEGIEEFIKEHNISLCHVTDCGKKFTFISKAAKLVPVVQTMMCPRIDVKGNYDEVSVITVISLFCYSIQRGTKAIIIEPPFDMEVYDKKYDRNYFGLPKDKIIVGSLGNIRKENNDFVEIANCYRNREDVVFCLKSSKKDLPIGNHVLIDRYLSGDEKMSLINCFDIFLYPTSFEAYGVIFLEAMACGVPILSYDDKTAIRDTISTAGLTVPYRNKKKLRQALDILISNKYLREYFGNNGKEIVKTRNNPVKIAKQYENIYNKLLV